MIQNFEPRQLERNFEPIEWDQYGNYEELNHIPPGRLDHPDHPDTACLQPNTPWWCNKSAHAVNIDIYAPMLMLIALVIGLMKLQKFKLKTNEK